MALSTAIFVGEAKEWIPELVERAKKLKVNSGKYVMCSIQLLSSDMYICENVCVNCFIRINMYVRSWIIQ